MSPPKSPSGGLPSNPRALPSQTRPTRRAKPEQKEQSKVFERSHSVDAMKAVRKAPLDSESPRTSKHRPGVSESSTSASLLNLGRGRQTGLGTGLQRGDRHLSPQPEAVEIGGSRHEERAETTQSHVASDGSNKAVWNRVTEVANALTINVSKAWATNVTSHIGEETPPGQDSRLTVTMRKYHLAKAKHPSELPDWLFNENERGFGNSRYVMDEGNDQGKVSIPVIQMEQPGPAPVQRHDRQGIEGLEEGSRTGYSTKPSSKATERLKAMRAARRDARPTPISESISIVSIDSDAKTITNPAIRSFGAARVGLPSGPRAVR